MSQTSPDNAPRRSPRFNGMVVLGVILLFLIAGVVVWVGWSADDDRADDNAAGALVQPAELPPPDAGAVPAQPGATGTGDAVRPQDARGLSPAEGETAR